MAINFLPQSDMPIRPQRPVTGALPGVGTGIREIGSSIKGFDEMLQKRIAAKAAADLAAREELRTQQAFDLKQESDKLKLDNDKKQAENLANYQEYVGGEGAPELTTEEKLAAAEKFGQVTPQQSISTRREMDEQARILKLEESAKNLIGTNYMQAIASNAHKEGSGEEQYNHAVEMFGKNGLLNTKEADQFLSKLKTNKTYHPPLSSNLDYRTEKDANQLLLNYSNKTFDLKPLVPHLNYIDDFLVKKGVKEGLQGDVSNIDIPGYGVGQKPFRDFMKSDEASNFRSRVNNIYAAWRNGLFGASLSEGEQKAFDQLAANQTISSVPDLINGLKALEDGLSTQFHPVGGEAVMSMARRDRIPTYEDLPSYRRKNRPSSSDETPQFSKAQQAAAAILKNPDKYTPEQVSKAKQILGK